ncbi:MAG: hypothetical protein ACD_7C00582G0008 [uncultured bacterium]|nr:MAG: hypothetical protein ACD_7C00582G0008 [uncultured bacterium]OFY32108.1 MAG: hypothetical protein A2X09_15395 [Bacteroidetes bacterium GWF2_43_11]HBR79245.1 hypothetical protein [Candidatus Moranbacteria bacterium]HCU01350.1 hypothetical protein [Candidatus Nomurabacteria bacterium]
MIKRKGVIYTCTTGSYDELIIHKYINPDWDYICFTDSKIIQDKKNIWKIKPLEFNKLDDVRNARWHKTHPHILFPEYEKSIWVDANIDILNNKIFNDVDIVIEKKQKMSIVKHPLLECIYDELEACISLQKDNASIMKKQIDLIKKDRFPEKNGLFDTSIIYREHNNDIVTKIMEDWWWWVENYSRRDQLSLNYVLWKNNYRIYSLSEKSYRNGNDVRFNYGSNHITKEELLLIKKKMEIVIAEKNLEIENILSELKNIKSSKLWKLINFYFEKKEFLNSFFDKKHTK